MSAQSVRNQPVTDVREQIIQHLEKEERTLAWLGKKANIPYSTLYSTFMHKLIKLRQDRLDAINKVLKTDFKLEEETPTSEQPKK